MWLSGAKPAAPTLATSKDDLDIKYTSYLRYVLIVKKWGLGLLAIVEALIRTRGLASHALLHLRLHLPKFVAKDKLRKGLDILI